ncbi:hypothetical protein BDZ94DRAFT_889422 [Collybia nuda]|uniref:Uncharacterized protein n=1 Tax=Collybia nuda TaxID=64659 RepID=A0A9P5Y1P1_9AGAR|nr:hypothetical protein BDZ94DRAFT_889422 [Collybia nuda]
MDVSFQRIQKIFKAISYHGQTGSSNKRIEASWYELWFHVLIHLCGRISKEITIAPQYTLIDFSLRTQSGDILSERWSLDVNPEDAADTDQPASSGGLVLEYEQVIPDFCVFYTPGGWICENRRLPLIIEIKPMRQHMGEAMDTQRNSRNVIKNEIIPQTLRQVTHGFAAYSNMSCIHVFCVVGHFWHTYQISRENYEAEKSKSKYMETLTRKLREEVEIRNLFDDSFTDYSADFFSTLAAIFVEPPKRPWY